MFFSFRISSTRFSHSFMGQALFPVLRNRYNSPANRRYSILVSTGRPSKARETLMMIMTTTIATCNNDDERESRALENAPTFRPFGGRPFLVVSRGYTVYTVYTCDCANALGLLLFCFSISCLRCISVVSHVVDHTLAVSLSQTSATSGDDDNAYRPRGATGVRGKNTEMDITSLTKVAPARRSL